MSWDFVIIVLTKRKLILEICFLREERFYYFITIMLCKASNMFWLLRISLMTLLWWLWLFILLFCMRILLSYLTHSLVLLIFLQVIMLRLFSFCLQVLDVVDFVTAQEEIFWSTSCRVFCSFLYSTSTMNMTCLF